MSEPAAQEQLIAIWNDESMEAVAEKVAAVLGVALAPRESSYWGDPYYSAWPTSEIKLTRNLDPMFREGDPPDERWFSAKAKDASYVVWEAPPDESVLAALTEAGLRVSPIPQS